MNAQGAHGWSADGRSFVCGINRPLALIRSSYVVWCDGAVNRQAPVLTGSAVFEKRLAATRGERRPGFLPTLNPGPMGLRCQGRARTRIELAEGICGERQPYLVLCLPITTERAEGAGCALVCAGRRGDSPRGDRRSGARDANDARHRGLCAACAVSRRLISRRVGGRNRKNPPGSRRRFVRTWDERDSAN